MVVCMCVCVCLGGEGGGGGAGDVCLLASHSAFFPC